MLTFLYLLKLENKLDRKITNFSFNTKTYDKYKFTLIQRLTVFNLFQLEVVQKCQYYQHCLLWKDSILITYEMLNDGTFLYLATMFPSGL